MFTCPDLQRVKIGQTQPIEEDKLDCRQFCGHDSGGVLLNHKV